MNLMAVVAGSAAVLLTACVTPGPIGLDELRPGDVLRTTDVTEGGSRDWILVRQISGSIEVSAISNQTPVRIEVVGLERLQALRGRARPQGALMGAFLGGLGGIIVGMACRAKCGEDAGDRRYFAPVVGFAVGAPLGAATGLLLAPVRWLSVRLR
jgi:hypothetical protein